MPYNFEPANFEFNQNFETGSSQIQEEIVPGIDPKLNFRFDRNPGRPELAKNRRGRPADNQVEKYVPTLMKEVLAKSFLKDPDIYLAQLRAKERSKDQQLNNLRPQLPGERSVRPRIEKPVGQRPDHVFEGLASRPRLFPNQDVKFDPKNPWNPNTFDNSGGKFKGGYVYNNKALTYDLDHEKQV